MTSISAPRITPEDIEAAIVAEHYFTARDGAEAYDQRHNQGQTPYHISLGLLTFCVLVLRNGFTVTGESACASPENFDAEIGRKFAREKAIDKVWPLLGFELKTKLAGLNAPLVTDEMVNRFLRWQLPTDFYPDGGITFDHTRDRTHGPVGTNLLHAGQAKDMLTFVVEGKEAQQS